MTDIHHEVILGSRSWEMEALDGRAAAIVDAHTHASRMSRGVQMVAGEDGEPPQVVLRAQQRLFRLGSEHGQARRGLCPGTQPRPISE